MLDGKVVSLFIEQLSARRGRLQVVFEHQGGLDEHTMVGSEADLRVIARSIAGAQDLIPVWRNGSWAPGAGNRPPACRYERRRP